MEAGNKNRANQFRPPRRWGCDGWGCSGISLRNLSLNFHHFFMKKMSNLVCVIVSQHFYSIFGKYFFEA